jgi:hypothetical protein
MTRAVRRAALGLVLTAACVGVAGCGDDPTGEKAGATKVALYVGVPLRGPWGASGAAVVRGVELGLDDAGGGAGALSLRLSERDTTDDDGITVGTAGAAREAGVVLRDSGAVGAISGVSAATVREYGLLADQTGVAFVRATGDDVAGPTTDQDPSGARSSVDLTPVDAVIRRGVVARVRAAGCARTVVADARARSAGTPYDLAELRPAATARATSWTDAALQRTVTAAVRGRTDCVVLTGDPSAGDPAALVRALGDRLDGRTLIVSRGAASPATAKLVREGGITAEAVVDDGVPGASAEGRKVDALYRRWFATPAPVGALAGWRAVKLQLRALAAAGARGNRRDGVVDGLLRSVVPGPPADGRQTADGRITNPQVSVARAEPYGWRAVRSLDPR